MIVMFCHCPEFQAAGVGTQLVLLAERALAELGCMKINLQVLETNQGVAAFYQSIGYAGGGTHQPGAQG